MYATGRMAPETRKAADRNLTFKSGVQNTSHREFIEDDLSIRDFRCRRKYGFQASMASELRRDRAIDFVGICIDFI
jgi:hypothetical protein